MMSWLRRAAQRCAQALSIPWEYRAAHLHVARAVAGSVVRRRLLFLPGAAIAFAAVGRAASGQDGVTPPTAAGLRYLAPYPGAMSRSIAGKLGEVLSAADFGFATTASAAANAAALQTAINALGATYGGLVMLPAGAFMVASDVIKPVTRNVEICGRGGAMAYEESFAGTRLIFTAGRIGIDLTTWAGGSAGGYYTLRNLKIDGNRVLQKGVSASGCVLLANIHVQRCTVSGIDLFNYINNTRLEHVSCFDNRIGLLIGSLSGGLNTVLSVDHFAIRQNVTGVRIVNARGFSFRDGVIESNTGHGLVIYASTQVNYGVFDTVHFEENWYGNVVAGKYQIEITGDPLTNKPHHIEFNNCTIEATLPTNAVNIVSGEYIVFNNPKITAGAGILLGANASYCGFFNRLNGAITDKGTKNWQGRYGDRATDAGGPYFAPLAAQTFKPVARFGGANTRMTFGDQTGRFERKDDVCHFWLRVTLTRKGSSAGALTVTGLPFTAAGADPHSAVSICANNLASITGHLQGLVIGGGTAINLYQLGTGTCAALTEANATDTMDLIISGSYKVTPA